jgi:hypothetical protein
LYNYDMFSKSLNNYDIFSRNPLLNYTLW